MSSKLFVLIRTEGLTVAQQAVQAGHAVAAWLSVFPAFWRNETLVYIQVPTERDLRFYVAIFDSRSIKYVSYADIDLGEEYTAIATGDVLAVRYTKKLPLWGIP